MIKKTGNNSYLYISDEPIIEQKRYLCDELDYDYRNYYQNNYFPDLINNYDKSIITYSGSFSYDLKWIFNKLGYNLISIKNKKEINKIENYSGLILQGGGDINPHLYREENRYSRGINKIRDEIEFSLIKKALKDNKPIMGICRGHQLIASYFGGSLYQDIFHERKRHINGRELIYHAGSNHLIQADSLLLNHIPSTLVNSYHHQAVKKVPAGFQVLAMSEKDRVIESIYREGILGVQFHPECLVSFKYNDWLSIFRWFVNGLKKEQKPEGG